MPSKKENEDLSKIIGHAIQGLLSGNPEMQTAIVVSRSIEIARSILKRLKDDDGKPR